MQTFWELSVCKKYMTLFTKNAAWINCKTREEATAQFTRKNGWQANMAGKHGRKSANECVKCGKWEEVCPQHIKIRDELEKVAAELLG